MNIKKPNFLIVGAARAGTTSLYYYLKQHPDISFSSLKEPKYFSSLNIRFPHTGPGDVNVDRFVIKEKQAYYDLFKNITTKMIGEASTDYLYYSGYTAAEIMNELGDIPIIIMLRNPIMRAYSAYMHQKRENREKLTFREALDREDQRLKMNFEFMWGYKSYGLYSKRVENFINIFSRVKIILTDQLEDDVDNILKEIFRFLNVEQKFKPKTEIRYNVSGIPKNSITRFVLNRESNISTFLREVLKNFITRSFLESSLSRNLEENQIDESDYEFLKDYFYEDILKLIKLTGHDLIKWWKM